MGESILLKYQCSENFGNHLDNRIGNFCFDIKANLMISRKMKIPDFHKISYFLVSSDTLLVGVADFKKLSYHFDFQYFTLPILSCTPLCNLSIK